MTEENRILFGEIIIACTQLHQGIDDAFFADALDAKLRDFINCYLVTIGTDRDVAQHTPRLRSLDSLLELLSQLEYLKMADSLKIISCRELILREKLSILRLTGRRKVSGPTKSQNKEPEVKSISALVTKPRFPERSKKAREVREEVLSFIRQNHRARTRDIVNQFGAISHRTILRSLKELVDQGAILKQSEGNVVQYVVK